MVCLKKAVENLNMPVSIPFIMFLKDPDFAVEVMSSANSSQSTRASSTPTRMQPRPQSSGGESQSLPYVFF